LPRAPRLVRRLRTLAPSSFLSLSLLSFSPPEHRCASRITALLRARHRHSSTSSMRVPPRSYRSLISPAASLSPSCLLFPLSLFSFHLSAAGRMGGGVGAPASSSTLAYHGGPTSDPWLGGAISSRESVVRSKTRGSQISGGVGHRE
jgi:hypothetical protein